jgi:hypothetical protein
MANYPITITVLQYLIFPNFTREFHKLFCARREGQGKEFVRQKSVRPKVLGAKPKQAGKKEGGWGEGIFARLLLSGGMAEGGFGGNSAMPERIQKEAAPAALLVQSRTQQKSFLFLLEEKIRRAQNQKCRENFFAG